MKREIRLPKLSPKMEQGVLVSWEKEIGDAVRQGDALYEVETDKVVSQIEADFDGVLTDYCVDEGDSVKPGDLIAMIQAETP